MFQRLWDQPHFQPRLHFQLQVLTALELPLEQLPLRDRILGLLLPPSCLLALSVCQTRQVG
jgi:hypothetical protein